MDLHIRYSSEGSCKLILPHKQVGHVTPEAAAGGPIALLRDGDMVTVRPGNRELSVALSEEEMAVRRSQWQVS